MALTLADYERLIKWGSCSWNYPVGWQGVVYHDHKSETDLPLFRSPAVTPHGLAGTAVIKQKKIGGTYRADLLAQYCAFKPFATLCFDMTHYRLFTAGELAEFARYLTPNFPVVIKVWQGLTKIGHWHKAGTATYERQRNENFLNARVFADQFLSPYRRAFAGHAAMFLFEFMRLGYYDTARQRWSNPDPRRFNRALQQFFAAVPKDFRYAVELRDRNLVNAEYAQVLRQHGVAHCFNQWESMRSLREQFARVGFTAPFAAVRVLTPPRVKYAAVQKAYAPYDRIHRRLPEMRADMELLIEHALQHSVDLSLLINNRAEGNAPATVQELDAALRRKLAAPAKTPAPDRIPALATNI